MCKRGETINDGNPSLQSFGLPCQIPIALSLSKGCLSMLQRRAVLRQAQHERF
jgi:hypothetical protein